jgi:alpha-L-rhamnosidase
MNILIQYFPIKFENTYIWQIFFTKYNTPKMYRLPNLINILFLLLLSLNLNAQIKSNWQAEWIGLEGDSKPNSWICYKKEFDIKTQLKQSIKAQIACDSKYWLFINGKLAIFEGQIKRGPNPNDTYYDEIEIGQYLKNGKNTISILLWYFGKNGFSHKSSGKAGLIFETQIDNQKILSDTTWDCMFHPAYGNTGKPFPNYRLPESNIYFDAQKDIPNWFLAGSKYDWKKAVSLGKNPTKIWGELYQRPIPQWLDSGLKNYEKIEREIKNDTLIIKAFLPQNLMITPYFEVKSNAGLKINIQTDNYRGGSEPNIRTEYITKNGKQSFESLAFVNGHFVIYKMPASVKILNLKYRETRFNTDFIGSFKSSDIALNSLHQKAINTLRVGLRDHIHDCPDRERALWWGDVVITMGELFVVADSNSHKAIKKAIHELVDWQRADGVLFSPVPAGNWNTELPPQMLASIGKFGFWKYYEQTGDKTTIEKVYPAVKKYLNLYKTDSLGLVIHRKGDWLWHDWGEKIDVPVMDNAWYYLALEGAANMAKLLNQNADYEMFTNKMGVLKPAFQKAFWTGEGFRSKDYKHNYDDRSQGIAIVAGLADKSHWQGIKQILSSTERAGAYMEKYILESYFIMNDTEAGLKRMKLRYQKMIESPLTTLWEGWDIGNATYGGGTYNHGWTGGPLTLMHEYIAGVNYKSNHVEIMPQFADLVGFNIKTNTNLGIIESDFQKQDEKITYKITLPKMISGKIGVPKIEGLDATKIKLNGIITKPTEENQNFWIFLINTTSIDFELSLK